MKIDIKIDKKQIQRRLDEVGRRLNNLKPAFKVIGRAAVKSVQRNFSSEGRPQRWEPVKEKSLNQKIGRIGKGGHRLRTKSGKLTSWASKRIKGNKILTDTGVLRNSVTSNSTKYYAEVGPSINVPYARAHQFGSKKQNLPARPYMVVQDDEPEKYAKMLINYAMEGRA